MTTYSVTLNISGSDPTTPSVVTQNVTTSDNISATITTPALTFDYWTVYDYSGCTVSAFDGLRGGVITITPSSSATSYFVDFETSRWSDQIQEYVYRYGRITGTISGGAPGPTYSVTGATAAEGGSAVTFTVTTSNVANGTTLYWTIEGASADVTTSSGSFTISSNTGSFSTSAIADSTTEGTEYFTINVRTGSTSGTIVATNTLTITDNSTAPTPTYTLGNTTSNEGVNATFTVTTSNVANGTLLNWYTDATTSDVSVTSGTVTINNNTGSFNIPVIADGATEGQEAYTVYLYNAGWTAFLASATLTINDTSQTAPSYALYLYDAAFQNNISAASEGEFIYGYFIQSNAPDGTYYWSTSNAADFSPSSGSFTVTSGTGFFNFNTAADSITEGGESHTIYVRSGSTSGTILTSASLYIYDTSQAPVLSYSVGNVYTNEGASGTAQVTTANVPNGTVLYWTVDATTADVSVTSGSFTISNNAGSFSIPAIADSTTEGTEYYTISIRTGSTSGTVVATSTLIIYDTSVTDTTPDQFYFTDLSGVALGAVMTSNTITVSGLAAATAINVSGGTYSINGGAYTSSSGTISNGQTVNVRHVSSYNYSTNVDTTLNIGGVVDTFTTTTYAYDVTPEPFFFNDQVNVNINSVITSTPITVSGLSAGASISVTGGSYNINGGSFTTATGTVYNGDQVRATHTSSSSYETTTNTTVTINGVSDTFSSTTKQYVAPASGYGLQVFNANGVIQLDTSTRLGKLLGYIETTSSGSVLIGSGGIGTPFYIILITSSTSDEYYASIFGGTSFNSISITFTPENGDYRMNYTIDSANTSTIKIYYGVW